MRGSLCGSSSIQELLSLRGTAPNLSIKKVVGLILGIFLISLPPAETQSAAVVTENEESVQRGIDASATRYSAMAEYYAAKKDSVQRGIDASAARYSAMAEYYAAKAAGNGCEKC